MATTTNFGWETPDDTDLVKDGALAIRTLGSAIDTSLVDLKGGTTGQVLSKASNTDLDYSWVTPQVGDITAVTAGTGLSGGGTTGDVTITNSMATEITASGDIIVGTGSGTFDNLPIGTTGQVLTADTTVSPYKVKWATPDSSSTFTGCLVVLSANQTLSNGTSTVINWGAETYDTDAFHSNTTNTSRITIPSGKGGYYLIYTSLLYVNNATGYREAFIRKNGTTDLCYSVATTVSSGEYPNVLTSKVVSLVAGDYIEVLGRQNSGGNLNVYVEDRSSYFGVAFIGA